MCKHCIKDDGCDNACTSCIDAFLVGVTAYESYPPGTYSATHRDYDGAEDAPGRNHVGHGATPAAATDDLIERAFLC